MLFDTALSYLIFTGFNKRFTAITDEYALFVKAFFSKKTNLDNVNYEFKRASGV